MSPSIRIASYNVLADAYLKPAWYAHVDPAVLDRDWRWPALARRIAGLQADVVCLQEVEPACFAALSEGLDRVGLIGVYAQKGQGRPDGCATFHRPVTLQLMEQRTLHYRDARDGEADSGHIALICVFDSVIGTLRIAGTHLRWAPDDAAPQAHIGWRQVRALCDSGIDAANGGWVICGDLNGISESAPLLELANVGFVDAYAGQPQATCNPNQRAKRIDYILHSRDLVSVVQPLTVIDDNTPLPSPSEPSDHLPVVARLQRS